MKYAVGGLVPFEVFEQSIHVCDDFLPPLYEQETIKLLKEIMNDMEIKELREKLSEQAFKLKKARANGTMVMQETERMKNLLVNNCDAIIDVLTRVEKLEQEVAVLNMELDDAERELDEAKKDTSVKKTTAKKKEASPEANE